MTSTNPMAHSSPKQQRALTTDNPSLGVWVWSDRPRWVIYRQDCSSEMRGRQGKRTAQRQQRNSDYTQYCSGAASSEILKSKNSSRHAPKCKIAASWARASGAVYSLHGLTAIPGLLPRHTINRRANILVGLLLRTVQGFASQRSNISTAFPTRNSIRLSCTAEASPTRGAPSAAPLMQKVPSWTLGHGSVLG